MRLPYKTGSVRVTSPFGYRTIAGTRSLHKGVDLVGTDKIIVAPCAGRIGFAGQVDDAASGGRTHEWGNYIRIDTDDGYAVYLCHLATVRVRAGQTVRRGEEIAVEGNTGYVLPRPTSAVDKESGRHLHFEVRKNGAAVDPTSLIGIQNRVGTYEVKDDANDADFVCGVCGLEAQTRAYIDRYRFAAELWRKLAEAMR